MAVTGVLGESVVSVYLAEHLSLDRVAGLASAGWSLPVMSRILRDEGVQVSAHTLKRVCRENGIGVKQRGGGGMKKQPARLKPRGAVNGVVPGYVGEVSG